MASDLKYNEPTGSPREPTSYKYSPRLEDLRDQFAMAALQGLISGTAPRYDVEVTAKKYAIIAYTFADAMMKEKLNERS